MKKLFIMIILMISITGCSFKKLDNNSIESIIDKVLIKENKLNNVSSDGYKYYLPFGTGISNKTDYNVTIKDKNRKYYLYIDAIAYYYKVTRDYNTNNEAFYSKKIENKNKFGYIEITEIKGKYFIEIMYNYAKIETYIDKADLQDVLVNISCILSSIKYNDKIIDILIKNDTLKNEEESFDIFKPKRKDGAFLDYIEEYDKYDQENKKPDEDNLLTDEDSIE